MRVKSIDILTGLSGTDKVGLNLEGVDSPYPSQGYPATATVDAQNGCGLAWAEKHFPGVEIVVMDVRAGKRTIKRASGVVTVENLRPGVATPFSEQEEETMTRGRREIPAGGSNPGVRRRMRDPEPDNLPPIQDNGPEQPDYGRGGDGPPAPWCARCQTYHFNRCTR